VGVKAGVVRIAKPRNGADPSAWKSPVG
jgi:hypothetical protein